MTLNLWRSFLIQYDNESRLFFSFYFDENENPVQRRSNVGAGKLAPFSALAQSSGAFKDAKIFGQSQALRQPF